MPNPDNDSIIAALLKVRTKGRPPFLVRNLKYVQACKGFAKKRVWDLSWTEPNYRAARGGRHIVLRVRPSQCILAKGVTAHLLNMNRSLPRINPGVSYKPYCATLRATLHVRQRDGHVVSFSTRSVRVRVWPQEYRKTFEKCDYKLEDLSVTETFDLSAVLPLLAAKPASLSLTVEVWEPETTSKSSEAPTLLGEVLIWDCETSKHGSAIPNAAIKVPLGFANVSAKPPSELVSSDAPTKIVSLEDRVMRGFSYMGIDNRKSVAEDVKETGQSREREREEGSAGSILLELTGSVEEAITQAIEEDKPHISAQLRYRSPDVPHWNGITRNDFICPWCHRNCHRYRALLAHFQVEHDEMKFAVQGVNQEQEDRQSSDRMPFTLEFTVKRLSKDTDNTADGRRGSRVNGHRRERTTMSNQSKEQYSDYVFANPKRFGSYMMTIPRKVEDSSHHASNHEMEDSDNDEGSVRTMSINPLEDEPFVSFVHTQFGSNCKVCYRHHDKEYNGRPDFCSEWCEIIHRKKEREKETLQDNVPLQSLASVPRSKMINYKEAMGHLKLYHVVSVHEANVELFEDDDPDSEEEVDQTWRRDLSLEAVRYLDNVSPKEKVLWLMWNKFAHEEYPLPSFYGERYSRYTLELFALQYSSQIKQFKLRLPFLGFLRALHRHGLIDSVAIKSIIRCLDGKKKRRDIQISARPELPERSQESNGRRSGRMRTARPSSCREVTQDPCR